MAKADRTMASHPEWPVALRATLAAGLVALGLKLFVVDLAMIDGDSMAPRLQHGDVALVLKAAYGLQAPGGGYLLRWSVPRRGEIVAARLGARRVVKRVAALGPDALPRLGGGAYSVPSGTVFLLGDSNQHSNDSRDYGPVPLEDILGRVLDLSRPEAP